MGVELMACGICGEPVSSAGPAVGVISSQPERGGTYIPFVEDLRTSAYVLHHLSCWAQARGIDSLVALVQTHDRRMRQEDWNLRRMLEEAEGLSPTRPLNDPRRKRRRLAEALLSHYDVNTGFIGQLRAGRFDEVAMESLRQTLAELSDWGEMDLDMRIVRALWWMPWIVEWQLQRLEREGKPTESLRRAHDIIFKELERILGVP